MKKYPNEWYGCDGSGHVNEANPQIPRPTFRVPDVSRRSLLLGASAALAGWLSNRSALADFTIRPDGKSDHILVVCFLRGGADGMSILVPYGEDAYYQARPNLAVASPKDTRYGKEGRAIDLDGFFGLHPLLSPLEPLYKEGKLLPLHAVGSDDHSRSHFEAMAAMERGLAQAGDGPASGWVARHLLLTEHPKDSPLRAVAFASTMPDSLRGATHATVLNSVSDFKLQLGDTNQDKATAALRKMYDVGNDEISLAGRETLSTLDALRKLEPGAYKPQNGAVYPETPLAHGFRETACLIRANMGLEVACIDGGGWDTHVTQGTNVPSGQNLGPISILIKDLGDVLGAFAKDMGKDLDKITVVVMTEFGRRLGENNAFGTDHGRGGAMFVMGGGVKGGRVLAKWPGLKKDQLDEIGDLRVTTDYRDVLGEVLQSRLGAKELKQVFAGYQPKNLGIYG